MRHGSDRTALLGATAVSLALLLSACSSSPKPTASHHRPHHSPSAGPSESGVPSSAPTSASVSPSTPPSSSSAPGPSLSFDPTSGGRHSHTCIQVSGTAPVDYLYYPVIVTPSSAVTLDDLSVTYADGVRVVDSWVAPAPADAGTGFVQGWPAPSIVTQSGSVQWSRRVEAKGAALGAGTPYTTFLHLRVYPDQLPYRTDGVVLTYHDAAGSHTDTWVDHVTYQAGKC